MKIQKQERCTYFNFAVGARFFQKGNDEGEEVEGEGVEGEEGVEQEGTNQPVAEPEVVAEKKDDDDEFGEDLQSPSILKKRVDNLIESLTYTAF